MLVLLPLQLQLVQLVLLQMLVVPEVQQLLQMPVVLEALLQQQMLALSRALMAQPDLILLDEPSLGLSPKLTKEIFEIVVRINRERGTTILLVEQNANMALNAADRGYVLENGRIVMQDTCERLREKEDIREFYLGIKEEGVRTERRWKKKKTWR
jgi:branched-chain amino acid transport system ATP-binding protein